MIRDVRAFRLLPALVLLGGIGVTAQQPTFQAGVDLVNFGVTVMDRQGGLVTDLSVDDFELLEDGRPQAVRFFARGDGFDERVPTHLGLMLDTSGSMHADLKLARSAAIKFLNLLPDAEDITLVDFDTEVRVARYPQRDFPRLIERIRMRKPDGWTALYDAVGVYLDGADQQDGRQVLVLYTDGADSKSALSFSDTLTLLKASRATVYAVGLLEQTGAARHELRMRLQQMVATTGGQAFFPSRLEDLDDAYASIVREMQAQYHLGYASTNPAADGAWRKVEIRLKRPHLRLRTRKGYFAPYQPR